MLAIHAEAILVLGLGELGDEMADWTAGYVAEIDYTYGYYTELNPQRTEAALLSQGIKPPRIENACELGFGQGLSINVHAAASPVKWWGTDFNPNQVLFARDLSQAFSGGPQIFDESFAEFCGRDDLPEFDYIGLHGIWSWVNDENHEIIVDFLRRKLRLGGVLYISYNTLPGWAAAMPLRQLMTDHAKALGAPGTPLSDRIKNALDFAGEVFSANSAFGRANPLMVARLESIKGQDRNYLAHEYFNRDWEPMYFSQMANWLAPAKLTYAGSAQFLDHVDELNLLPEQRTLLAGIADTTLRQTVRDYLVNQQFRKDYWVKGAQRLNDADRARAQGDLKVIATCKPEDFPTKVNGMQGEAQLTEAIYRPILEALAGLQVHTVLQLANKLSDRLTFQQINQALLVMAGMGHVHFVRESADLKALKTKTAALNRNLCERAKTTDRISFLASPLTGGGIALARFSQLFVLALMIGKKTPEELASFAWSQLANVGQALVKEGEVLLTAEENLGELTSQAKVFLDTALPALRALHVV